MNRRPLPVLFSALLFGSLCALGAGARQASPGVPSQEIEADDGSERRAKATIQRLLEAQGGQERVEALKGFEFRLIDVDVQPPATEGAAPVEIPAQPIQVALWSDPEDRRVRLAETIDLGEGQQELVRVAAQGGVLVTVDGEPRASESLAEEARAKALELLLVLDLVRGVLDGQVIAQDDGRRTRDGVEYDCLQLRFPEGRGVLDTFRIYVDEAGLVRRCDHFDGLTGLRKATLELHDYLEVAQVQLPQRIDFFDREFELQRYWKLVGLAVDPEWPAGHFELE